MSQTDSGESVNVAASSSAVTSSVDAPENGIPSQLSDSATSSVMVGEGESVNVKKEPQNDDASAKSIPPASHEERPEEEQERHEERYTTAEDSEGETKADASASASASAPAPASVSAPASAPVSAIATDSTEQSNEVSTAAPASAASAAQDDAGAGSNSTAAAAKDQTPQVKAEGSAADFLRDTFDSFAKQSTASASAAAAKEIPHAHDQPQMTSVEVFRLRIERDRRDGDAWLGLIDDAMQRADLPGLREVYQEFFDVYPNAARQWQDYASVELSHSEFANVETIFTRCLRTTPSTDLWRFYLSYTRRVNPLPPPDKSGEGGEREQTRKVIEGAYEFALRFIGYSRDAGDVWRDYIALLKERETANQWQSGQKMDDIRRTYQRAVAIPLANVEQIWREYDAYENGLNRITAKKFLGDRSAAYMTARGVLREMRTLTDSLQRPIVPRVPCWCMPPSLDPIVSPLTIVRDRHHVELWKKYLRWEESNPLHFGEEDGQSYQSRVLLAYRKAAMHMRFYPEVWFMAGTFLSKNGREEEAATWLQNGLEACPGSGLLTFAFVEHAERQGQATQGCGAKFDALLNWIHAEIDNLQVHLQNKIASIDQEAEAAKASAAARKRDEGAAEEVEGEEREEGRKREEERERRRKTERDQTRPKVEELKEYAGLVWIKYMHFVRRTEGQRPSRAIFARARKSKNCTWQVFEANALMEYHCSKDVSVAAKVFELALKTFGQDEAFVVRYLDFLLSINDDNNARALFERTVITFAPERARPIWDRWCEYEYSFGDSASIARIEERLSNVYPDDFAAKRLLDRNTYMDLDIVGPRDLGLRAGASAAGGAGASAAERAVAASRELAQDPSLMSNAPPTGPRLDALHAVPEEATSSYHGQSKRARISATPPPTITSTQRGAPGGAPTGPRGVKRSVSPPSRYVPPPRGEPGIDGGYAAPPSAPVRPAYLEIPEQILYFLDALPKTALFDGPIFTADNIVDCLMRSNIAIPSFSELNNGIGGTVRSGAPSGRGARRGFGRPNRRT